MRARWLMVLLPRSILPSQRGGQRAGGRDSGGATFLGQVGGRGAWEGSVVSWHDKKRRSAGISRQGVAAGAVYSVLVLMVTLSITAQ